MKLIEFLNSWKIFGVAYGGGEPFTHPDIVEIIRRTWSETGLDVSVTTNGFSASEKQLRTIEDHIGEVRVSIHSLEACAVLGKFMNRRFDLGVNLLLMKDNASSLARMVEKCVGMGVKDFLINSFRPVGRGANIKHVEPTVEDHLQLGRIIERFASKAGFKVSGRVASVLRRLIGLRFIPFEGEARGRIIAITVDREVKPSSLSEEAHPFHRPEEIAEIYSRLIAGGANRERGRVEARGCSEKACW
jgi:MoaA/NifB/PqqE/SkfB family radical SAM enzyme